MKEDPEASNYLSFFETTNIEMNTKIETRIYHSECHSAVSDKYESIQE